MALIFWLSAQPDLNSGLGVIDLIGRKAIHMTEYGLLTFLWWRALRELLPFAPALALSWLIAVGYSLTDEYHQTFVSGRHGVWTDSVIDAVGATLVVGLIAWRGRQAQAP